MSIELKRYRSYRTSIDSPIDPSSHIFYYDARYDDVGSYAPSIPFGVDAGSQVPAGVVTSGACPSGVNKFLRFDVDSYDTNALNYIGEAGSDLNFGGELPDYTATIGDTYYMAAFYRVTPKSGVTNPLVSSGSLETDQKGSKWIEVGDAAGADAGDMRLVYSTGHWEGQVAFDDDVSFGVYLGELKYLTTAESNHYVDNLHPNVSGYDRATDIPELAYSVWHSMVLEFKLATTSENDGSLIVYTDGVKLIENLNIANCRLDPPNINMMKMMGTFSQGGVNPYDIGGCYIDWDGIFLTGIYSQVYSNSYLSDVTGV